MMVLVDTSVWSLALRRQVMAESDAGIAKDLAELIKELRVLIIGPIRQELLTGISEEAKFEELKTRLGIFIDTIMIPKDFEFAASLSNACRRQGIQGSHIDFMICAISIRTGSEIFTLDMDFEDYARFVPIKLYRYRKAS
jgi:predicted nucleic acid-binding protein